MNQDEIVGALIGLVGACSGNPKTDATDGLLLRALAFPPDSPADDGAAVRALVDAIHAEKARVAPGCAVCPNPCGNTADYEMARIEQAGDGVRRAKRQLLARLRGLAAQVVRLQADGRAAAADLSFFYKALTWLGCDLEEAVLRGLLPEADKLEMALRGLLPKEDKQKTAVCAGQTEGDKL